MKRSAPAWGLAVLIAVVGAAPAFAQTRTPQAGGAEPACHATTGPLPSPALEAVFADPFVYCAEGRLLAVASNWAGVHVPVAASADLSAWATLRDEAGAPLDAILDKDELPGRLPNHRPPS